MGNERVSKQNGVEALCGDCNTLEEIGRFPCIPRDLADSVAQILEERNCRRVRGAQSLESNRLKMVWMGKVCVFGWLLGRCHLSRSAGRMSRRAYYYYYYYYYYLAVTSVLSMRIDELLQFQGRPGILRVDSPASTRTDRLQQTLKGSF